MASSNAWYILSALHGLVSPDGEIVPYDLTLVDLDREHLESWSHLTAGHLEERINEMGTSPARLIVRAGERYRAGMLRWLHAMAENPLTVEIPMAGMGIGQQLAWLKAGTAAPDGERSE